MAILATFNIGDLSPYVEDTMEDPSTLRSNPSKKGDVDTGESTQGHLEDDQAQGD